MDLWPTCWSAIKAASGAQAAHQIAEDPARRFVALIGAVLSSKIGHLARADKPDIAPFDHVAGRVGWRQVVPERAGSQGDDDKPAIWSPQGPQIGWCDRDGETAFLEPEAAYSAAQKLAASQGQTIGVGARTLWKRLAEAGLLAMRDKGRNTYSAYIGEGQGQKNTIAISLETMAMYVPPETGSSGLSGSDPSKAAGAADFQSGFSSRFSGGSEKSGCESAKKPEGNCGIQGGNPENPDNPDFAEILHGQLLDRVEHEGQPWADDPAEQHNWGPESPFISGDQETGFSRLSGTCDYPGCQHRACLTGPEGSWCADHMQAWQRPA